MRPRKSAINKEQFVQTETRVVKTMEQTLPFEVTSQDHLALRRVDLVELCERYSTPLFVFDEEHIRKNYRRFRDAFIKHYPKTIVCYSIKTNNNLAICSVMRNEGAYAEVGSGLDLHIAKEAGFPPERIIFDGLFKSETVLNEALDYQVSMINIESFSELEILDRLAKERGITQSIGIRISTVTRKRVSFEGVYCNPLSRFGFSLEETFAALKQALKMKNLEVEGLMIHPYWGIHWFLPFVKKIQEELGLDIRYVNFGGGFPKGERSTGITGLMKDYLRERLGLKSDLDPPPKEFRQIEEFGRRITEETKQVMGNMEPTLVFEPGRYLIHDAGLLLLRVGVIKKAGGYKWVVVDGGCNLNSDWLERREIRLVNRATDSSEELVNVVGPLLFARDFVTIKKELPKIRIGDILVVLNSGAYTLSNSTQFLSPRPAAVLIRPNGEVAEIRKKETYGDVVRMDKHSSVEESKIEDA